VRQGRARGHEMLTLCTEQRNALIGNYDIVLALLSCLETGHKEKKLVDAVVDHCEYTTFCN
jgi:hypothetical protein